MRNLAVLLVMAALGGCASAPSAERAAPESDQAVGLTAAGGLETREPVEISVETGDRQLGAYTVTLVWDRTVVRVLSVEPTPMFAPPSYSRLGFSSGKLTLSAFQVEPGPRGRTIVARVAFESIGEVQSALTVRLITLVDPDAVPIKGAAGASRDRVP